MDFKKLFRKDRKLISVKQASQNLGVSNKTVYGYIYMSKLRATKQNGHWLIAEDEIKRFLEGVQ